MNRLNGLMALVAFLSFGAMSTLAFAGEDKKEEKDKGGHVVVFGDEKKDEKKDSKGGQIVFSDDKKDEKKDDKGSK